MADKREFNFTEIEGIIRKNVFPDHRLKAYVVKDGNSICVRNIQVVIVNQEDPNELSASLLAMKSIIKELKEKKYSVSDIQKTKENEHFFFCSDMQYETPKEEQPQPKSESKSISITEAQVDEDGKITWA